ncbi:hypothetical protein SAMN05428969_1573 [Devosia sp. YR412]|uniref:hypothetical protein n=1 Tax=Devosia sp. YR412 TaxID=1881030 RepID=UPI0008AEA071|nr:hypothetical protein [Devosia sp. YR412]SEQ02095.1 hypothetical protein SAMN05428969_1573 [Devosia sp. YR412]
MMLIWSGWGFLVALVWATIGCVIYNTSKGIVDAPVTMVAIVLAGSLVISALIWGLDRVIVHMTRRTLIDQRTGVTFDVDARGSFFFVPMRFWVYLVPIINLGLVWASFGK